MARRKLSNPFDTLDKSSNNPDNKQDSVLRNTNTEYRKVIKESNNIKEDNSSYKNKNSNNSSLTDQQIIVKTNDEKSRLNNEMIEDNKVDNSEINFMELYEEKSKKPTIEETHTRRSYLIRNDLEEKLQRHAKKKKRGFMTLFINYAIEQALKELDKK
ncbi:hypothetical protein NW801_22145 [Brevibacillus laterosporus]|uniref:Uncharacterized protein n=1 Tax=Brevibacillus halotolerans TaxID=1507437 RepID=A0ABT4I323_9BACL|nr:MULTISPECIES: hypothetical protein [Brevibacillus]MCR8987695.1 hypothetical protein [Brevibacillus laterosporus]MCZ0833434.1 hypothetical protein [Brevibacillus halotolerans]